MSALSDDDRLRAMAYVDGELAPVDRAAFEARLAGEPALADAVARERALRAGLRGHYDAVLGEPMPANWLQLLGQAGDGVSPSVANDPDAGDPGQGVRRRGGGRRRWSWPEWGAMAACTVLGLAIGARFLASPGAPDRARTMALATGDAGVVLGQGALQTALESQPGGGTSRSGGAPAIGLSFRDHAREFCRTFTLGAAGSAGIACKHQGRWTLVELEHQALPSSAPLGDYRTAGSALSASLLAAVDAMRDGEPLDRQAEARARSRHWQP